MEKTTIIAIILTLLAFALVFVANGNFTGEVINNYSYTTAICNETLDGRTYCEDYYIICDKNQVKEISSTGFAVYQPSNWEDPRGENSNLC